ncbi:hypothetical protein [Paracoccus actinidiae]|nr:hypothetical protein [Paracoccus sp. M09]
MLPRFLSPDHLLVLQAVGLSLVHVAISIVIHAGIITVAGAAA